MIRRALALLLALALALGAPTVAWAGPVNWQEVPATDEGRQWWDSGSLRLTRSGRLSVLSRYQPAEENGGTPPTGADASGERPRSRPGDLYVMEIDCDEQLYRDTSINGLPQWGSPWQPVGGDGLLQATVTAVCEAGGPLLASR